MTPARQLINAASDSAFARGAPVLFLIVASFSVSSALAQSAPAVDEAATVDTSTVISEWQRLRTIPAMSIDDPMGFLIYEAGAFRRLTTMIETLQANQAGEPIDARLELAILRSQYLAASIDGIAPEFLLMQTARAIAESSVPRVRAEAAYRVLTNELMMISSNRGWDDPLLALEHDLLSEYLACFGSSPRAASAVKRIADDAAARQNAGDLRACRDLVDDASPQHPIGVAFEARARGIELVGTSWAPRLNTLAGTPLNWVALRDRPIVVLFAAEGQRPSAELLAGLTGDANGADESEYHLVVVQVAVSAVRNAPANGGLPIPARMDKRRVVRLSGGWRARLLTALDIRTLPTALIVDRQGTLRDIIRHHNWNMEETVRSAVARLAEHERPVVDPTSPDASSATTQTNQP